jgi:hypothetical protein
MKKIKYKVDEWGVSKTKCPNGFTKFKSGAPKFCGSDCMFCRYRNHVDFDNHVVECNYVKNGGSKRK